ncbi:MAG: glutamate--tRNA ligase [Candidatus Pacebacteria bacterium]|nr:glutamate--tRNA ligase [Candidatus Paceibacterota bacterium]
MNTEKKVITRMAPSPTGKFHIGGVRTALFNYLFAKHHNGTFIIRSEDTDKERSKPEYEENMLDTLEWLGMKHDAFYRQSERTEIYQEHIKKLIDSSNAYEAEASKDNPDMPVIRFKNPNKIVKFTDLILGDIEFDTTELGDFVIARNIETPIYHLTVVVDDGLMEISHILRGQEHINNTPRQILILEALGFERPEYAHIPLIMSPRGGKLSKRDPEVIPAYEYKDQGILPEALVNFLAFIGWNPGDEREIMSMDELIADFDISKVQKSGGAFNIDKMHWINKQYLNEFSDTEFAEYIAPLFTELKSTPIYDESVMQKIIPIIRERTNYLIDVQDMITDGELDYYFAQPEIDTEKIIWKKDVKEGTIRHLEEAHELISNFNGEFTADLVKESLWIYAEEVGKGNLLWPLRYALSGRDKSPDPFTLLATLGKKTSLERITFALSELNK